MQDPKYLRMDEIQKQVLQLLQDQVDMRKDMQKQLVGNLYPSVVVGEMQEIMRWQDAIRRRG